MTRAAITEAQLDAMANEGRISPIAMRLAIDAGADWPSLDGDAQDAWHERAIDLLRSGEISKMGTPRTKR